MPSTLSFVNSSSLPNTASPGAFSLACQFSNMPGAGAAGPAKGARCEASEAEGCAVCDGGVVGDIGTVGARVLPVNAPTS